MLSRLSLAAALLTALSPAAAAGIVYADANLTTGADDGSSWANAYQGAGGLRKAVNNAVAGDQVFAAQGLYRPAAGSARGASIQMASGVEIYGGFLGGEASPAERPPFDAALSVIDGDLAGNDGAGMFNDNSFHIVKAFGADATAILDGFELRGGNANGSGNDDKGAGILCLSGGQPTVRSCRFVDHRCTFGGAAGYINGAGATFIDCSFEDGNGGSFGGAFDIATGLQVRFDRCVFRGNTASRAGALEIFATSGVVVTDSLFVDNVATGTAGGGGLWIGSNASAVVTGCTIVGNQSPNSTVAGLRVQGATAAVGNCILWDNVGQGGAQGADNQINTAATVTYSIVEGGFAGTGNLAADPQFTDAGAGDYTLTLASPAIDAGDSALVSANAPLDLGRAPRRVDEPGVADTGAGGAPVVDMGAFESSIGVVDLYCVPLANSSGAPSILTATGSVVITTNDVNLVAEPLPMNEFGYFLLSSSRDSIPVSDGVLCLGAPQLRFNQDVLASGSAGRVEFSPDLTALPQGQVVQVGETWYFQLWHRDGTDSNFSSSLAFTWQ